MYSYLYNINMCVQALFVSYLRYHKPYYGMSCDNFNLFNRLRATSFAGHNITDGLWSVPVYPVVSCLPDTVKDQANDKARKSSPRPFFFLFFLIDTT
jgi:hypothetical protein